MQALKLLNEGKLDEAVSAAKQMVREEPGNLAAREILVEILCLVGDFERADKQAESILMQAPDLAVSIALLRQLIRGEITRRECWTQGRVPEFLGEIDEVSKQALLAVVANRQGRPEEAAQIISQLDENRPPLKGRCNANAFSEFRDLDDLCLAHLEVVTSTGKYYWVPFHRIESLEFEPVSRPKDLFWRQCRLVVQDGPDGVVYVPALYVQTDLQTESPERLGHATQWIEGEVGPVVGTGQRVFLVGEDELPIMEIKTLEFELS